MGHQPVILDGYPTWTDLYRCTVDLGLGEREKGDQCDRRRKEHDEKIRGRRRGEKKKAREENDGPTDENALSYDRKTLIQLFPGIAIRPPW
jgi:hypothetical protein